MPSAPSSPAIAAKAVMRVVVKRSGLVTAAVASDIGRTSHTGTPASALRTAAHTGPASAAGSPAPRTAIVIARPKKAGG